MFPPTAPFDRIMLNKNVPRNRLIFLKSNFLSFSQQNLTSRSAPASTAPRNIQFWRFAPFKVATRRLTFPNWLPSRSEFFKFTPGEENYSISELCYEGLCCITIPYFASSAKSAGWIDTMHEMWGHPQTKQTEENTNLSTGHLHTF